MPDVRSKQGSCVYLSLLATLLTRIEICIRSPTDALESHVPLVLAYEVAVHLPTPMPNREPLDGHGNELVPVTQQVLSRHENHPHDEKEA